MNSVDQLSEQILAKFANNKQTREIYEKKLELKLHLESLVSRIVSSTFRIYIFGSSANKLGTNKSDVDMFIQTNNGSSILQRIHMEMSRSGAYTNLELVRATVPLLRFKHSNGISADLSFNSPNGVRNTHLLNCYARLDERVAPLVVIIKLWAKGRDINDSFRNTLSSYGYVLLVIHYLQCGCNPPVLPNLLELMPHIFYAYSDIATLDDNVKLIDFKSNNHQCLGELLLGFFRYYTQEFDFDKDAISIKTAKRVEKSAVRTSYKFWETICIQDPFNGENAGKSVWKIPAYNRIKDTFRNSCAALARSNDLAAIV